MLPVVSSSNSAIVTANLMTRKKTLSIKFRQRQRKKNAKRLQMTLKPRLITEKPVFSFCPSLFIFWTLRSFLDTAVVELSMCGVVRRRTTAIPKKLRSAQKIKSWKQKRKYPFPCGLTKNFTIKIISNDLATFTIPDKDVVIGQVEIKAVYLPIQRDETVVQKLPSCCRSGRKSSKLALNRHND